MSYTQTQLCNIVGNLSCCISDKGEELVDSLHRGHDWKCCSQELAYLIQASKILECYIPVGTLESEAAVDACGLTNTVQGFDPIDISLPIFYNVVTFDYTPNGQPLIPLTIATTFTNDFDALMDAVVTQLTIASGVTWSWTHISGYDYYLCAPYTKNGDTVFINIIVTQETELGDITMNVTLSGGVAPETPVYRTELDNCLTSQQIDILAGKLCKVKIKRPRRTLGIDLSEVINITQQDLDVELR